MTVREPVGTPLRDAAMTVFLGSLFGSLLFAVWIALTTATSPISSPRAVSEIALGLVVFASVAGLSAVVLFLPLGIVLVTLLRRGGVGKMAGALACTALGGICAFCFYTLLSGSGMIALLIPAPAVQGVATAYIYMRFSDG